MVSELNDILMHFFEFSNANNGDKISNASQSKILNKNGYAYLSMPILLQVYSSFKSDNFSMSHQFTKIKKWLYIGESVCF